MRKMAAPKKAKFNVHSFQTDKPGKIGILVYLHMNLKLLKCFTAHETLIWMDSEHFFKSCLPLTNRKSCYRDCCHRVENNSCWKEDIESCF